MADQTFSFTGKIVVTGCKRPGYAQVAAELLADGLEACKREGSSASELGEYTARVVGVRVRRAKKAKP